MIKRKKAAKDELKLAKKHKVDIDIIKLLAGDKKGNADERKRLNKIRKNLKGKFYKEVVYFLTHLAPRSEKEAVKVFSGILKHKEWMGKKLERSVSVQTAALDYLENVKHILKKPTIIEEEKIKKIAKDAEKDKMTGAFNKKVMLHDLKNEISRAKRYGTKFALLIIDLDNLKQINDKYGHVTGDKVLKALSACLKKNIRSADSFYRFGGDEFAVLLPKAGQAVAEKAAQKLLARVRKTSIKNKNKNIKISVSIGAAAFNKNNLKTVKETIKAADTALYSAKKSGKDKAVLYKNKSS